MRRLLAFLAFLFFVSFTAQAQTAAVPICAGVNDTARFAALKSLLGTSVPATIKLPAGKICAINSNLTLTANLTLDGSDGGQISIANVAILTIQGPVRAGARPLFLNATAGHGTVSFSGNTSLGPIYPQWWGAIGDGTTDCLAPITAALVAGAGHEIHFVAGDYLTTSTLKVYANTTITGEGYNTRVRCPSLAWNISLDGTNLYGIFSVKNVDKVRFTNLRIYGTRTLVVDGSCDGGFPGNCHSPKAIYLEGTGGSSVMDGIMIDHCWIEHTLWEAIWEGGDLTSVLHVQITNNQFKDIDGPSTVTGNFERAIVSNNVFQDVLLAIGITGRFVSIVGNQIKGSSEQGIGVGEIGNGGFVEVSGNIVHMIGTSGTGGAIIVNGANTNGVINITANTIALDAAGVGVNIHGGGNVDVSNNSIQGTTAITGVTSETSTGVTSHISLRGNTVVLKSEGATPGISNAFSVTSDTGSTAYVTSAGNKVIGITRAHSNQAYNYRPTQGLPGTIVANMVGDMKTDGNIILENLSYGIVYSTSATDNVPLFLSNDLTAPASYTQVGLLGMLQFGPTRSVTIASGVIALASTTASLPNRVTRIVVGTEGGAASDDLDTISGGQDGDVLIVSSVSDARDVVLKNGTGNLSIGSDLALTTASSRITLTYDSGVSRWVLLSEAQPSSSNLSDVANIPLLNAANVFTSASGQSLKKLTVTAGVSNFFKGADVASAATITATGNLFHVTGTTNITSVSGSGIAAGTCVTIIFDGVLTFTDGSNLKLAGNFVTTADDVITIEYDGTSWFELSRSVN